MSRVFQQIYYFVHNGTKKSPLHMSIAQSIHNECRSKKLSKIMNRLSIFISYDELERIDFTLANQLLNGQVLSIILTVATNHIC